MKSRKKEKLKHSVRRASVLRSLFGNQLVDGAPQLANFGQIEKQERKEKSLPLLKSLQVNDELKTFISTQVCFNNRVDKKACFSDSFKCDIDELSA